MPNRFATIAKTLGRRVLTVAALTSFAVTGAFTAQAASPAFNGLTGVDYPTLQVAPAGTSAYSTSLNAQAGDVVNLFLWDHNSVNGTTAENVLAKYSLPSALENSHTVTASLSATNAATVTGSVSINVGAASTLQYIPGSARFYRNSVDANGNSSFVEVNFPTGSNSDNLVTSGVNLGSQQGCIQYAQGIIIQARIVAAPTGSPAVTTNKKVANGSSGDYADAVTASPGDTVVYRIYAQNTGTADGSVTVTDVLDGRHTYVPGSSIEYGKQNNADFQLGISDSLIKFVKQADGSTKITWAFGNMRAIPQDAIYIVFQAKVADKSWFTAGTTVVINNTATTSIGSATATTNKTAVTVNIPATPVVSFTLRKDVMNISSGENKWYDTQLGAASPGQTLAYRLVATNTGNTPAQNVVLKDLLPAGVSFSGQVKLYSVDFPSGKDISGDDIVKNGLNIGTVPNGNTSASTLVFTGLLTSNCSGQQTLVNTGQVFYNNQKMAEDTATVSFFCNAGLNIRKDMKGPKDSTYVNTSTNDLHPGDVVYYRINVQNSGNTTINNPTVKDVLPKYLDIAGPISIDGEFQSDATTQFFFGSQGIILTNLTPGLSKEIIVKTTMNNCPDANIGNNPVVNTATAWADGIAAISAKATGNLVVQIARLP
jgi:uncharacterized repeat protein (TIGR01451 family)